MLTEATRDRRFHHVASSILRLTPYDQPNNRKSTELVIIGGEQVERFGSILSDRVSGLKVQPANLALASLNYMRQYHNKRLPEVQQAVKTPQIRASIA